MVFLSLNIRGTGGTLKSDSFRRVFDKTQPNIVFLQETLESAQKSRSFMHAFRMHWFCYAVNSFGTFGGLLASWDPSIYTLVPSLTIGGLLLACSCLSSKREIALLDCYVPCVEKRRFWTLVADSGMLSVRNLIIAGDLNLTLSLGETWGGSASAGSLEGFFKALFQNQNLIDIEPRKVVPTWRNRRSGSDAIWK
jgi:hypothetical protein